jgi:glucosamine--fructose-6-phosphate aminotransferase (isomerizing)
VSEAPRIGYRAAIARQPEALADCIAAARSGLARLDLDPFATGVLGVTGIGASFAAATVIAGELARRGRRAFPVRCADLAGGSPMGGGQADGIIALSHRGRSVETVEALRANPAAARLAITRDPESPVAKAAGRHLRIDSGADATPSGTGYTGALAVAGLLVDRLCGADSAAWERLPEAARSMLRAIESKGARLRERFAGRRAIDCVGAGASLGTADEASLLVREAARIPAAASETRHYLHGPMEAMDASTGVLLFGEGREVEIARQLQGIGCPVLLVTARGDVAEGPLLTVIAVPPQEDRIARAILDILAAQLLAAALSDEAGLTDARFRYPQADTQVKPA